MPKFQVHLGRLIRQEKVFEVEAASPEDIDIHQLYEDDDGAEKSDLSPNGWEDDADWGCEEGTHVIIDQDGDVFEA